MVAYARKGMTKGEKIQAQSRLTSAVTSVFIKLINKNILDIIEDAKECF